MSVGGWRGTWAVPSRPVPSCPALALRGVCGARGLCPAAGAAPRPLRYFHRLLLALHPAPPAGRPPSPESLDPSPGLTLCPPFPASAPPVLIAAVLFRPSPRFLWRSLSAFPVLTPAVPRLSVSCSDPSCPHSHCLPIFSPTFIRPPSLLSDPLSIQSPQVLPLRVPHSDPHALLPSPSPLRLHRTLPWLLSLPPPLTPVSEPSSPLDPHALLPDLWSPFPHVDP